MQQLQELMRYQVDSEIDIEATPEQVWKVFGNFASWGEWNDFAVFDKVPLAVGKRCKVVFHLDGGCMKTSLHDPEVRAGCGLQVLPWQQHTSSRTTMQETANLACRQLKPHGNYELDKKASFKYDFVACTSVGQQCQR